MEKVNKDPVAFNGLFSYSIIRNLSREVNKDIVQYYEIQVKNNLSGVGWKIQKRYSEFFTLFKEISSLFSKVVSFPKKTLFKVTREEELLKRSTDLNTFLQNIAAEPHLQLNDVFLKFLELAENDPGFILNKMSYNGRITHGSRGFKTVDFSGTCAKFLLTLTYIDQPEPITAKEDKNLKNVISRPIGSLSDVVSSVEVWERKEDVPTKQFFTYEQLWRVSFQKKATCFSHSQSSRLVAVGFSLGKVCIISYEENAIKHKEDRFITVFKRDNKQVVDVAISSIKQRVYCIGGSNMLRVLSIRRSKVVGESNVSHFPLTTITLDEEGNLAFIGDDRGCVHMFDISEARF